MTAQSLPSVKQALLARLQDAMLPLMQRLVEALPDELASFSQAEQQVRSSMLDAARHLLTLWTETADRSIARPCCSQCGMPMRNKGLVQGELVSLVGTIPMRRPRWRCLDCGEERYPHDERLRFGKHAISWPLARVCGRLAADTPSFELARRNLQEDYGVHLAIETLRIVGHEAGCIVTDQEDAQREAVAQRQAELPQSPEKPDQAYVMADGTMIHTEGGWHEIRVNAVVTLDAQGNNRKCRSQARFLTPEQIGWLLVMMARQAGYQNARVKVFLSDGAVWLWKLQEQYFGGAVAILDWYHLAEKVHAAAEGCFGQATDPARTWAQEIKDLLWQGKSADALQKACALERASRSPSKRQAAHALRTYLENQKDHIDYPRYREMGLSIGSGVVESQCKTLVGGRCKQAGMRDWTRRGAEGILRLRAARQDGTFDKLWKSNLSIAA